MEESSTASVLATACRRSFAADMLVDIPDLVEHHDLARLREYAESGLLTESLLNQRCSFYRTKVKVASASPLWLACALGYRDIAEVFLRCGANINATNEFSESPLWIASKQGKLNVVQLLLSYDQINVDLPNYSGQTPLIAAGGQVDIIRLLVEAGASLTYGTPHTGTTVLHSCSRSSTYTASAALSYLLDDVPMPAPVMPNAYGSLPVLSAAARRDERVVQFWAERVSTQSELEQAADAWDLLAAQSSLWKRSALDMVVSCWRRAVRLRATNIDEAHLSWLLQNKRERCAAVAAAQARGPLVGVVEMTEGDCCEADTIDERIDMMLEPMFYLIECAESAVSPFDNLEAVLQHCCLCSERVLGLVQKGAMRSRLIYALWLEMRGRRVDASEMMLDFMTRQLAELAKGRCSHRFWHLSLIHIIQVCLSDEGRYRGLVASMGLDLVQLGALAVERCQVEKSTVAARHRLLACFLHLVQLVFLSGDAVRELSGAQLVETLDATVVSAVMRCVRANVRGLWNRTLLHLAMDNRTSQLHLSSTRTHPAANFPHLALTRLLVELKAPVNKADESGNLPLHLLLSNDLEEGDVCAVTSLLPIVQCLVRASSHLDIRNCKGESCLELAKAHFLSEALTPALTEVQPLPLLCLAAQAVHRSDPLAKGVFPELKSFVLQH